MDFQRRNELVELLFDKPFSCQAAPIYMDVAFPPPEPQADEVYDGRYGASGCVRTVNHSNEVHVLEALFAHTRYSGDEDQDTAAAQTPIEMGLTVDQMAEILAHEGTFTFLNPPDCTYIIDVLDEYLVGLEQAKRMEPHAHTPPEEDLEKLRRFRAIISPLVETVRRYNQGIGSWDAIASLFTVSGFVPGRGLARDKTPEPEAEVTPTVPDTPPEGEDGYPKMDRVSYQDRRKQDVDPFTF